MLSPRLALLASLVGSTALFAACSVVDEDLLGSGGGTDSTTSGKTTGSGDGGATAGTGGAGTTGTESTTSTSTTTSTATTGQTGTVTTGGGCTTVDDCPGDDSECAIRTCENSVCAIQAFEQGVELARQTAGDCVKLVCDGEGGIETVNDDGDLPADDGNECTQAACNGGLASHEPVAEGTDCGVGEFCNADADCVECLDGGDCPSGVCTDRFACAQAECGDNVLNGDETDLDCGGPDCGGCMLGEDCALNRDCLSNVCIGTCQPSCTDGILNNGESAIDCGGNNCNGCGLGLACNSGNDCGSGFCPDSLCRPQLFFSEYVEGSSSNKALEVFNYGNEPVDLAAANCSVRIFSNGSPNGSNIGLTGTIAEFGTHVACNSSAGAPLLALCDQTSGAVNFNGDDAVSLECDGFQLDVIGQIGTDPGTMWGSGMTSTLDHTLRRKGSITEGDTNGANAFDPAVEWDGFAADTFSGLGDHP